MSYLVLARKYRPQSFGDLVGQEHVTRTIQNALKMDRVPHAFLLTGVRGVGKTTTARILARALNCLSSPGPTPDPCGTCPACEEIALGRDLDVVEIDAASNTGVDSVRTLQESLPYRPARDRFKVYVVDEVHMLSQGAFNAFLKTLEEPPPHVKFVFATTDPQRVPETVRSRCQRHDFKMIPHPLVESRVREILAKESIEADDAAVSLVAREAAGSLRDALSLLDQVVALAGGRIEGKLVAEVLGLTDRTVLYAISAAVLAGDAAGALSAFDQAVTRGADLSRLARDFLEHLRNLVVASLGAGPELLPLSDAERAEAAAQAKTRKTDELDQLFLYFAKTADEIARSAHAKVLFEMTLVRMAHREPLVPIEDLVGRLEGIESRLRSGGGARAAVAPARTAAAVPAAAPTPAAAPAPVPVAAAVTAPAPAPVAVPAAAPVAATATPTATEIPAAFELTGDRMADWRRVLAEVEGRRPALASLLEKLVPLAVSAAELRLGFAPDSFEGAQASDPQRLKALREIARQVLGPQTKVEVVPLAKEHAGPTVASEDAAARASEIEAAKRRVEAHPAVQLAAEVLGPVSKPVKIEVE